MTSQIEKKEIGRYLLSLTQKAATGNNEAVTADGGAAVSANIVDMVYSQMEKLGTIFNKAKKLRVTRGPTVKIPGRVNTLANEPSTGVRSYWTTEADQSTASKVVYSATTVDLGKLITRVPVTGELSQDVANLADMFVEDAAISQLYKIEREMFLGLGSAIKGVTGSGGAASLGVEISSDVTEAELKTMLDVLHPMAYANAEWYVAPQQYSVITSINYTNETALVFEGGKYYLFGFPLVVVPQLTTSPSHIILGDFTKFALAYIEPRFDISDGCRFLEDEREFRLQQRIGGATFAETSVLDDGNTYAFFVCSAAVPVLESSSSSSSSSMSSESVGNISSSSSSSSSNSSSSSSSKDTLTDESSSSESWDGRLGLG